MLLIYKYQTAEEQAQSTTDHNNGMGFNSMDAYILSEFAKSHAKYGRLTPKMLGIVYKKMPKYAAQILRHAGHDKVAASLGLLAQTEPVQD
jgi:hypothetical protein